MGHVSLSCEAKIGASVGKNGLTIQMKIVNKIHPMIRFDIITCLMKIDFVLTIIYNFNSNNFIWHKKIKIFHHFLIKQMSISNFGWQNRICFLFLHNFWNIILRPYFSISLILKANIIQSLKTTDCCSTKTIREHRRNPMDVNLTPRWLLTEFIWCICRLYHCKYCYGRNWASRQNELKPTNVFWCS